MNYNMEELLAKTIDLKASDLHITVGLPPCVRVNGKLEKLGEVKLLPGDTRKLTREILNPTQFAEYEELGDYDLSYSIANRGRFRINAFKQRGSCAMAIRSVSGRVSSFEELHLPPILRDIAEKRKGLVLVTGPTGMGKSTTLACMIDYINTNRSEHILTLEDPIEYLHAHKKSIVNQRELRTDFQSFADGLRAGLRQDPDVILLGEMRDVDTMQIALTAAETGHLVFSTLHTIDATSTIDRIIDVFPPHQQQQAIVQLANVLEAVVAQQLLPKIDGTRVVATEIMTTTTAIKNLIREKKTHQIPNIIQTGAKYGMHTMDASILELFRANLITEDTVNKFQTNLKHMNYL